MVFYIDFLFIFVKLTTVKLLFKLQVYVELKCRKALLRGARLLKTTTALR